MSELTSELRDIRKQLNDLRSRMARTVLDGRVKEVKDNMVRLELLEEDPHTGEPFLSPWVRVQEEGGDGLGGYSSYMERQVGQNMKLISPNGEIGQNSLAIDTGHNDENPTPGTGNKKVFKHGSATISMSDDNITIAVGGMSVVITADEIVTYGKTRLNDGNLQIHRVSDVDSDLDAAVGGAPEAYA